MVDRFIFITIEEDERVGRTYEFYDGVYWAIITATTVGYGDITPATTGGQIYTVFFALISIPLFLYSVTTFYTFVVTLIHRPIIRLLERMQVSKDPSTRRTIYRLASKNFLILCNLILFMILLPISAMVYTFLMDDLDFQEAMYFVFITQLTIGYGEIHPDNKGSRIFSIFLITIMVVNLAALISAIVDTLSTRVEDRKRRLSGEEREKKNVMKTTEIANAAAPDRDEFEQFYKSLKPNGQEKLLKNMKEFIHELEVLLDDAEGHDDDIALADERRRSVDEEDSTDDSV